MQRLIVPIRFCDDFVFIFLPTILSELMISDLHKNKGSEIITHIKKTYNCTLNDLYKCIKNIKIDRYKNICVLHYDSNDIFKKQIKQSEILHTLNYGTLSQKGLGLIDRIFIYAATNLGYLYRLYAFNVHKIADEKRLNSGNQILR